MFHGWVINSVEDFPIYTGSFDEFGDEIAFYHDYRKFPFLL